MGKEHKSLSDINWKTLINRTFHPSPLAWEDNVLYFLMIDRFSDNNEKGYKDITGNIVNTGKTGLYKVTDNGNAILNKSDADFWNECGGKWMGGNLDGLKSKIGYLKRLGITTIWISPIFKQVSFQETYHGYGIQNFLDIDAHFGSKDDLNQLVKTAHEQGIYVILDIILNHSGNVFSYNPDRYWTEDANKNYYLDPRWDGSFYQVDGYNDANGKSSIPFGTIDLTQHPQVWPDGAVWPSEFQNPQTFTQKGRINNWDHNPEYLEGDFSDLKDIDLGNEDLENFIPSDGLKFLCDVYKYWIAFADIDGYRIDTIKHMGRPATRYFVSVLKEFAQSINKENFYLVGEIAGGRKNAYETLQLTGLNAALGIDDVQSKLRGFVKGKYCPAEYFNLFRNSELINKDSHTWFRDKVVIMFNDHDQICTEDYDDKDKSKKLRFAAYGGRNKDLLLPAIAVNLTTMGIPCIYYGTEQAFDGEGGSDKYLREAMFGGEFGAFRSRNKHFFDESTYEYQETAKIVQVRRQEIALRRGRQFLREISGNGINFGYPEGGDTIRSVIAWSRIFNNEEILCAINTDENNTLEVYVTIDNNIHKAGDKLRCLYSCNSTKMDIQVQNVNGRCVVLLKVPKAGFVIYKK
ncbi:MAG: alpha-amylase [Ignavibacteria bacterium]|nr:alpha-amylase [Ignavibacteria bacterium]